MRLLFSFILFLNVSSTDIDKCLFQCTRKGRLHTGNESKADRARTCHMICTKEPETTTPVIDQNVNEKPNCMMNCSRKGASQKTCNVVCNGESVATTAKPTTKMNANENNNNNNSEGQDCIVSCRAAGRSQKNCVLECNGNGGGTDDNNDNNDDNNNNNDDNNDDNNEDNNLNVNDSKPCMCRAPTAETTTDSLTTTKTTKETTTKTTKETTTKETTKETTTKQTTTKTTKPPSTTDGEECVVDCLRMNGAQRDCEQVCTGSTTEDPSTAKPTTAKETTTTVVDLLPTDPVVDESACHFVCSRNGSPARTCNLVCGRIQQACHMECSRMAKGRAKRTCVLNCESWEPKAPEPAPAANDNSQGDCTVNCRATGRSERDCILECDGNGGGDENDDDNNLNTDDNSCSNECEDCPAMQWKGGKYSTLMYEADNAFVIRMNVPNTAADNDIRNAEDYAGFFILSRRWCGVDLLDGIMDGEILMSLTDYTSMYEVVDMHHRSNKNDKNRDSVTIQFRQDRTDVDKDLPGSSKKDQFMLLFVSAKPIPIKNKEKCFKIMTGVLPKYYDTNDGWAKCAGDQKDVGY